MVRNTLPPRPPYGQTLLDLLTRMCSAVLIVDGAPHPEMGQVIDAVMRTHLTNRVTSAPTAFTGHTAAWMIHHSGDLAGSLTHYVQLHDHVTTIQLATRLLLLAPPGIDPAWLHRVSTNATRLAQDKRRFTETAVLHELTARCHLADGNLDPAEVAYDAEQQTLLALPEPDRKGRALSALAWRRIRLAWSRDDHPSALRQLDIIARHLDLDPDPTARLRQQIALGEVLYRMGRDDHAVRVLHDIVTAHRTDAAIVEWIDAGITLGHALRSHGIRPAVRQWIRTRDSLQTALSSGAAPKWDHNVLDRLGQRDAHLATLITWPDDVPPRRAEFTVLGPAGDRMTLNATTNHPC